jgi:hypothetical protein
MKTNKIITACLTLFLFTACENDNTVKLSTSDYIIFGHFYGECVGEQCVEIFRLEENKLFEDTKDQYPKSGSFYDGKYIPLSQRKFKETQDLLTYFPIVLLDEADIVVGNPDATDGGGLYIEYNYNGVRKFWLLDNMKNKVPTKYHNFIDKVNEKIRQLQ